MCSIFFIKIDKHLGYLKITITVLSEKMKSNQNELNAIT